MITLIGMYSCVSTDIKFFYHILRQTWQYQFLHAIKTWGVRSQGHFIPKNASVYCFQ